MLSHLAELPHACPLLTFTLVVEVTRLLVPHFDRQVTVGTGDIVHRLRLEENDLVVALAHGYCAVLQGPRLIHLREKIYRVFTWSLRGDSSPVLSAALGSHSFECQKAASIC